MDVAKLNAIDIHVHVGVSCRDPQDPIIAGLADVTIAHYPGRNIGLVRFTADMQAGTGPSCPGFSRLPGRAVRCGRAGRARSPSPPR
jgi:hypothetical protein